MFTQPAPSPPILATSTSPVSPASPQRPSRLRGLSYLRNYTQNHLHSRDNNNNNNDTPSSPRRYTLTRATSYPTPTSSSSRNRQGGTISPVAPGTADRTLPSTQKSSVARGNNRTEGQENSGSTSGWLPFVDGDIGVLRIATPTHLTPADSSATPLPGNDDREDTPLSGVMGRTRSATTGRAPSSESAQGNSGGDPQLQYGSTPAQQVQAVNTVDGMNHLPSIRFSQHQDVRAPRPSLVFGPMGRTLPTGREIIRVGRYSERENQPNPASNVPSAAPIGFKSKVVSRRHCEFWYEDGQWFIKDVKSSSGTFLNHVRLSSPGTESKPYPVKDGDIVQLGIDFKGGEEMIFRCVKIRIELNRGWQNALNSFNVASHKRLRNMAKQTQSPTSASSSQDCTICLGPVAPCQSLFVAPCSHTWHYKCVRRIINSPLWPQFICPNCRAVADLDADVDDPFPDAEWEEVDAADMDGQGAKAPSQAINEMPVLQVPGTEGPPSTTNATNGSSDHEGTHDNAGEDTTGSESELQQAMKYLSIGAQDDSTTAPLHESHSSVAPVNIRSGRSSSRNGTGSNARTIGSNLGDFVRNDRTPSPNDRLPPGMGDMLSGHDGPMTPRNDAGPFVFDGSAGRASGARMSALNLSGGTENHTPES